MITVMRRGTAMAGAAVFVLSGLSSSSPVGATEAVPLQLAPAEDCFGEPLLRGGAIYVPENSTGWTYGTSGDDVIGDDLAYSALRRYLDERPNLARLTETARELRIWSPLARTLRVLQA